MASTKGPIQFPSSIAVSPGNLLVLEADSFPLGTGPWLPQTTETGERNPAWLEARKEARLTGSRVPSAVSAPGSFGSRLEVMLRLAGLVGDKPKTWRMTHGIEGEIKCVKRFEEETGLRLWNSGLYIDDETKIGSSPDGFTVASVGKGSDPLPFVVEIKCPTNGYHKPPSTAYLVQMHCHMLVTGVPQCLFISYVNGENQYWVVPQSKQFEAIVIGRFEEFWRAYEWAKSEGGGERDFKAAVKRLKRAKPGFWKATEKLVTPSIHLLNWVRG